MKLEEKEVLRFAKNNNALDIDVIKLLKVYLNKLWLIILIGVIGAAFAFGYTAYFVTPKYQSTVKMYVNNGGVSLGDMSVSISSSAITTSQNLVATYIEILQTRSTLERVIDDAQLTNEDGSKMKYKTLLDMISASAVKDTAIFAVNVTDGDPERAKLIANTITQVLPYQITTILEGSSVKVVDYAITGAEIGSGMTKNVLIGFFAGVVLVCGIEFLLFINDHYIHDEEYLIENYNIPLLTVIPDLHTSDSDRYGGNYKYGNYKYGKYKYNYSYKGYGYGKYGGYHTYAYQYSLAAGNQSPKDKDKTSVNGENDTAKKSDNGGNENV